MKNHDGIPMPGAKRKNQNSPREWKEKHPLVLPKVNAAAVKRNNGPKSVVPAKQIKLLKMKNDQPAHNPGSMLTQKTNEDYNKQPPHPEDPNLGGYRKPVGGVERKFKKNEK